MRNLNRFCIISSAIVLWLSGSASADILLPGSKRASHQIKFENLQAYQKEYKFFFLPLNDTVGKRSAKEQEELNKTGIVHVSGISTAAIATTRGMHLVAVPRKMLKPDGSVDLKTLENPTEGVLKSDVLVSQIRVVPNEDKDEFWTIYTVKITDGKLQLALMRHDEPKKREKLGSNLPEGQSLFAGLSAVIAFGLLGLRLRR
ncbi:MAG: hypothetical protein ACKO85_14960 [Isosphaeraceae bacterium]